MRSYIKGSRIQGFEDSRIQVKGLDSRLSTSFWFQVERNHPHLNPLPSRARKTMGGDDKRGRGPFDRACPEFIDGLRVTYRGAQE